MKLVTTKFWSGGLHEKHVVATWNLGNHLSICFWAQGNQEKPVSRWPVAGPSVDLSYIYTFKSYRTVNMLLFGYKTDQPILHIEITALRSLKNTKLTSAEKNVERNTTKQIAKF